MYHRGAFMLSRREALATGISGLALLTGAFASGAAACARASAPSWPRRSKYDGVDFIELFPVGADETAPLVVGIHGMGDKPDSWIESWSTFPARAQIVLPRAFTKYGEGFSWFEFREGATDAEFGAEVGAAEEKL